MKITLEWLNSQPSELASNGREIRYNCPNCEDTSKHMYVNYTQSVWYCFKCGKGGKIESTNKLDPNLENYSTKILGKEFENKLINKSAKVKSLPHSVQLGRIKDTQVSPALNAISYLVERGITQQEIDEYSIRVSLEKNGPYKNSIIFPITRLEIEYFVCRKYDGSKPKYVNAPWPKDDSLFIADANKGGLNYPWVICEGIFDALAVCRVGYNALALLGKVPTSQQLKRLSTNNRYLIYLDDDAFSQAINLKLQLGSIGTKSQLVVHKMDAAQLYLEDATLLRSLLDGATKQLNEYKK